MGAGVGRLSGLLVAAVTAIGLVAAPSAASAAVTQPESQGLRVVVSDTVKGAQPRVVVSGPDRFRRVISTSQTFASARPGSYRVAASSVRATDGTAWAQATRRSVTVVAGRRASVSVAYSILVASHTVVLKKGQLLSVQRTEGPITIVVTDVKGAAGYETYKVGDVIAAPSPLLTQLVKVTKIAKATSTAVTMQVTPTTLVNAVPQGVITAGQGKLTASLSKSFSTTKGASSVRGSKSTCKSSAVAQVSGNWSGSASLAVSGSWSANLSRSWLRVTASAKASAELTAMAKAAATCSTGELQIGKPVTLGKVTFTVGNVPVVIVPTLTFTAKADASVGGSASVTIKGSVGTSAWLQATAAGKVTSGFTPPSPKVSVTSHAGALAGSVDAIASVRVEAAFYGVGGPFVQVNLGPKATLTPASTTTPLTVNGNLTVDAGLNVSKCLTIWSAKLCAYFDAEKDGLIAKTWKIYPTASQWTSVTTNGVATCGIRADQTLWCWGSNRFGAVGTGDTTGAGVYTPAQVQPGTTWTTITTSGWGATCGIRTDETLWCWGFNGFGEVGNGDTTGSRVYAPAQVQPGTTWTTITTSGWGVTCGIRTDETLWCWGYNGYGAVGIGDTTSSGVYAPAQVAPGTTWKTIATNGETTCGIRADQTLWCWGDNGEGAVGIGDTTGAGVYTPAHIQPGTTWTTIATNGGTTCGIRADRTLWCWGNNGEGEVGKGDTTGAGVYTPVQVQPGTTWATITANFWTVCGLRADKSLWCWGNNYYGAVGNGGTSGVNVYTPARVQPGASWTTITANFWTVCGLRADRTLWCWGYNGYGAVGNGDTSGVNVYTPAQVQPGASWTTIATNGETTCGIRADETLWCWGYNEEGEVGNGDTSGTNVYTPVQIK